jgi:hypothetical protein
MTPADVLELLLQRPALLWSQDSATSSSSSSSAAAAAGGPIEMLQHLRSQLPSLALPRLLQRTPAILTAPKAQVEAVLTLLLSRLALSKQQAAEVLVKHPQLLVAGAGPASLNLGFLVGLGLRQPELQHMLLRNAEWLMRPLQELTTQWQFLSTVAKVSGGCACVWSRCCVYVGDELTFDKWSVDEGAAGDNRVAVPVDSCQGN